MEPSIQFSIFYTFNIHATLVNNRDLNFLSFSAKSQLPKFKDQRSVRHQVVATLQELAKEMCNDHNYFFLGPLSFQPKGVYLLYFKL